MSLFEKLVELQKNCRSNLPTMKDTYEMQTVENIEIKLNLILFNLSLQAACGKNFTIETFYNLDVAKKTQILLENAGFITVELPGRTRDCMRFYVAYLILEKMPCVHPKTTTTTKIFENYPQINIPDVDPEIMFEETSKSSYF